MPAPLIIKPGQLEKDPDLHHEFLFKGSPLANKTKEVEATNLRGSEMKYKRTRVRTRDDQNRRVSCFNF